MFAIPDSSAMDATAYGGGPGTFVSTIATGQPEQIASLVAERLQQAEQFLKLIEQARSATQELEKAWSGTASQTAVKKMTDTLDSFEKMVKVIEGTSQLLGLSGTLVKTAQEAYTTVVSAVNPVVASLASNWWTYWAAVSLSTSASAGLRAFIAGIEALLSALGGGELAQEIAALVKLIGDVEKLVSSGSHGGSVPASGSFTHPSTTGTGAQLKTPPQIASASGQKVAAGGGQDPTVASLLGQSPASATATAGHGAGQPGAATAGAATGGNTVPGQQASYPGQYANSAGYPFSGQTPNTGQIPGAGQVPGQTGGQNTGWIPVDPVPGQSWAGTTVPVSHAPVPPPTPAPQPAATPPGDVTITTTYDGVSTTVTMPVGTQTDISLHDPHNGSTVTEHIMVGAAGNSGAA